MVATARAAARPALRVVFVSDTAVARGAVYGARIMAFAGALAARGHRLVVISPALDENDGLMALEALPSLLAAHDWREPLVLKCQALANADRARRPALLRRLSTALDFALHGGTDRGWSQAAAPLARAVADQFAPDVVWATFGSTSNLVIAQRLARRARAPWVADLKDNVDAYLPRGIQRLMARRFADMTAATSNADLHADAARRWLGRDIALVRSGFAPKMMATAASRPCADSFLITLIGSVYGAARANAFFAALARWTLSLPDAQRARVRLRYAGIASDTVRASLALHPIGVVTEVTGNIAHRDLAALCQAAAANCYIWLPSTFHHKALELLASRRPVIAFAGEHPETIALAAATGGDLTPCRDAAALGAALDLAFARWRAGAPMPDFRPGANSWQGQAELLEDALRAAIARGAA